MTEPSRLMMALLLTVCSAAVAGDAAPAADVVKDWVMPDAERTAVVAVVERAIAAGLPDAKGGHIHIGTLSVLRFEEGAKDPSNKEDFEGAHLHLADGRWLIGMHYVLQPAHHWWNVSEFLEHVKEHGKPIRTAFEYASHTNDWWLSASELKSLVGSVPAK